MPSITDWIEAIGVGLTVPVSLWGVISLFIKDRNKERKLTALEELAKSQNQIVSSLQEQVNQLSRQTGEFQYQSSLMREQNNIFEKQLELQIEIFEHEKGLDMVHYEIEVKKSEIENQKRINDIRPFLFSPTNMSASGSFRLDLINRGGSLSNLKLIPINDRLVNFTGIPDNTNIDKGASYKINCQLKPDKRDIGFNQINFEFNLEYEDMDGNKYQQNVQRINTGQYIFSSPILQK